MGNVFLKGRIAVYGWGIFSSNIVTIRCTDLHYFRIPIINTKYQIHFKLFASFKDLTLYIFGGSTIAIYINFAISQKYLQINAGGPEDFRFSRV